MPLLEATKRALLQELTRGERYGYELRREVKRNLSTIYYHLQDLQKEGLVESRMKGRRRLYRLTERGEMLVKALRLAS